MSVESGREGGTEGRRDGGTEGGWEGGEGMEGERGRKGLDPRQPLSVGYMNIMCYTVLKARLSWNLRLITDDDLFRASFHCYINTLDIKQISYI